MPSAFHDKKHKILQQLSVDGDDYSDLSPKGSVDEGVRHLCDEINHQEGYVTTSSCAGRTAVFLEGTQKKDLKLSGPSADGSASSQGGKGGGKWLFVSHDPVDMTSLNREGAVQDLLGISKQSSSSVPALNDSPRFVHLKFEPMILHILTSSLSHAQHALTAALAAGFRESGISSISGTDPMPIVAVRTQGLAFDSIIAYEDSQGTIQPMVSEEYLRALIQIANSRFMVNAERKERFRRALLRLDEDVDKVVVDWEPADVRRERKRAEGLRKREQIQRGGSRQGPNSDEADDIISDLTFSDTLR